MASFETKGIIKKIGVLEQFDSKNGKISKRQLVIQEDPNEKGFYDIICITLIKDNAEKEYKIGSRLHLKGNVKSKEWKNKYYTEISCWYVRDENASCDKWEQSEPKNEEKTTTHEPQQQTVKKEPEFSKTDDSLPF